jgi:transcriptional regulator with XRE-family HTH domain
MEVNKQLLRDLILLSGLTQREFSKQIGVTEIQVSKWLSGVRNIKSTTLEKIANKFNLKITYKILVQ